MPSTSAPVNSPAPLTARSLAALLLVFALVWFCNLDFRRLVHPDEGRYAEIPREMVASGDWVTPRLDGVKYFEKPALQYWVTAATYEVFGVHEWAARLWPALAGFLGVIFIGYVGFRVGGPAVGLYSAAVLGGSVAYVLEAHILTLDAALTLWMTVGLGGLFLAQRDRATAGERRTWMWLAWAALALATLSKGLIGIVLPGGVLVLYSLIERDWALWRRLHLVSGMLVFLAIAAPWFVVVSLRNPEFFNFFFIHEHFTRFLTTEHRREGPWWYFIPIFMVGILPWLTVLAWTARRSWTEARATERGFSWQRFAIIWSVFIFLFFSASGSKLPSYILPIFPAMALVIGWQLTRIQAATLLRLIVPLVVAMGLLALVALAGFGALAERIADEKQPLAPLLAYGTWIRIAVVVALAGGILAWWWLARGERTRPVLTLALASLAWTQLMVTGFDALAESRSTEPILLRATTRGALATGVPFYSVRMYDQTLPYYLGRTVIPVAHADELAMGIALEPDKAIATVGEWKNRWEGADQAYAIMQPEQYEKLRRDGVPMVELARDPRRVIVARR
ncbi:MAG TPA: glycosyltransferase family 39 protein [Casimicrobiaceae bacterium]|jgi:4-amino-4-deoxy-L-arabinose transferase-like glycosyltransferase|nr:glycosyltransferase family 39 protein [Casimicrobiaceae bacterium]